MLEPLKQWYCDVCGEVIEKPSDGYVIFRSDDDHRHHDFTIIHQGKCDNKRYPMSLALDDFLGPDGLSMVLSFLSPGPVKRALGDEGDHQVQDFDEYVDFVRRVQVPHYEDARRLYREDHDVLDRLSDDNEVGPYIQETMVRLLRDR